MLRLKLLALHERLPEAEIAEGGREAGDERCHGDDAEVAGHQEAGEHEGGDHLQPEAGASGEELPARGSPSADANALLRALVTHGWVAKGVQGKQ